MSEDKLSVRLYGQKVGVLERLSNKKMHFTYKDDATFPISLSMPLKEHVFDNLHCKPFFAGLLPEMNRERRSLGRLLGTDESDIFSFLKEMGRECAGAISFRDLTEALQDEKTSLLQAKKLDDKQLRQFILSIPERSLIQIGDDLRTILSGENNKSQVCVIDNHIALAPENGLTTHVLKPALTEDSQIMNEYFCLKIAKNMGLDVVDVTYHQLGDIPYLLISRYDRKIDNQLQIHCLHQEDFCQALGVSPMGKMEIDRGPGLRDIFQLLNKTVVPAICRNQLMERVIFNYLICNTHAHGKHFSLLYLNGGQPSLAPLYGVRCDYHEKERSMAMKIGTQYDYQHITPMDWQQFCKSINYAYPAFKRIVFNLMEKCIKASQAEKKAMKELPCDMKVVNKICVFLEKQCEETLRRFKN